MLLFIFLDKNEFKKTAESEELPKRIVTFYKNESKKILKTYCKLFQKTEGSSQNNL